VYKDPQRRDIGDQHVDPQIEFVVIDQEGVPHVLLHHQVLSGVNLVHLPRYEDALALRKALGFNYEMQLLPSLVLLEGEEVF